MDDQRLRQQRFDEPAGLKQRRIGPGVEDEQHHAIGGVVEDRADRPDEHHEFADVADIPSARRHEILLVDVVGRDRRLREIVEQVVDQHLDRRHRQERQEELAPSTLNMLPKFELAPILMYLMMLPKILRPSMTPSCEHQQALFEQDDVGRFLGDIDGGVDRDADIGGFQRRAVVDAVAQEADHVALACRALTIRSFCAGVSLAKTVVRRPCPASSRSLSARSRLPSRMSPSRADLAADLARDDLVVAGENLHLHALARERGDRLAALSFGGSRKAI